MLIRLMKSTRSHYDFPPRVPFFKGHRACREPMQTPTRAESASASAVGTTSKSTESESASHLKKLHGASKTVKDTVQCQYDTSYLEIHNRSERGGDQNQTVSAFALRDLSRGGCGRRAHGRSRLWHRRRAHSRPKKHRERVQNTGYELYALNTFDASQSGQTRNNQI